MLNGQVTKGKHIAHEDWRWPLDDTEVHPLPLLGLGCASAIQPRIQRIPARFQAPVQRQDAALQESHAILASDNSPATTSSNGQAPTQCLASASSLTYANDKKDKCRANELEPTRPGGDSRQPWYGA